jgi:SAM-dependent methyltransferase
LYRNLPSMYSNFSSNIEQCSNCGHGLTNPSPGSDTVKDIYLNTYSIPSQKLIRHEKRRNSRLLVRWMQPIIRPNKVLEVGCMFGDLLAVLDEFSISASGIELDEFATITACNEGREVLAGNFEILLRENFDTEADTIVLVHCLEHFSDPQNVLSTLFRKYPNVVYILIVVPNFDSQLRRVLGRYWGSFQIGTHYHHFTPNSLNALLTSTGWSVKAQKFAGPDSIFFGATFINFLMRFNVRVDLNKPQQFFSFPMKILGFILSKLKKFGNEEIWCIARRPINPTAQHR